MFDKIKSSVAIKLVIWVVGAIIISVAAIGIFGYNLQRSSIVEAKSKNAEDIAASLAAVIDGDSFKELLQSGEKNDEWYRAKAAADKIRADTDTVFLYVIDSSYGSEVVYYLEGTSVDSDMDLGDTDDKSAYADEMFETLRTGELTETDIYTSGDWGIMVSGFAAVKNSSGAIVGVVGADIGVHEVDESSAEFVFMLIVAAIIICIGLSFILFRRITTMIGKPVGKLTKAAQLMAEGDVNILTKYSGPDEIGRLGIAFTKLADDTRKQVGVLKELADGNLDVTLKTRGENDVMSQAMAQIVEKLRDLFSEIQHSAKELGTGANEISSLSSSLAEGATEQASSIAQITQIVHSISEEAIAAAAEAREAVTSELNVEQNAQTGREKMDKLFVAVKDISEASQKIAGVIKVIDDIAFQTNILALNAAVEAARAGQQGKGFAVVAEEVRSLAGKSAEAANSTSLLISETVKKAGFGAELASEASGVFTEIIASLESSKEVVEDLALKSETMARDMLEMNENVGQISNVVSQTSAMAEQSSAASEELASMSVNMEEQVNRFRLGEASEIKRLPQGK
ncbi:MAG: methyl-accepting chemotaxis protein [Oscillospiraceae bacterium]|jgi:methyl-accepting chemotaxis protein|nr:methyl-accepting chemotaxis protein [Oscillospiraceae bacterium]